MTRVGGCGRNKRNARQFSAKVGGVALAIFRMVQDGVYVMEDVPLGDGRVRVADAKLFERPVGDVLATVASVLSSEGWLVNLARTFPAGYGA